MKKTLLASLLLTSCFSSAFAEETKKLENTITVTSTSIKNGESISEKFAFCMLDGKGKTKDGGNISPQLSWSGAPKETKSFAVVAVDPDVPAKFDDANKDGKIIAEDFPRQNFYHWILADVPTNITEIPEGKGKNFDSGVAMINDFASFIKDKPAQTFIGYDGPCPPWNDARLHHYHFTVYALDEVMAFKAGAKRSNVSSDIVKDIEKHAIAKGELVGTYSNFVK